LPYLYGYPKKPLKFFTGIILIMSKLLDNVRNLMRVRHYSYEAVRNYVYWIRQYIFFRNVRHPAVMGAAEAERFLTYLAVEKIGFGFDPKSGLIARLFLYKEVLQVGQKFPFDPHQPGNSIVV
jgi:hypothetical protein